MTVAMVDRMVVQRVSDEWGRLQSLGQLSADRDAQFIQDNVRAVACCIQRLPFAERTHLGDTERAVDNGCGSEFRRNCTGAVQQHRVGDYSIGAEDDHTARSSFEPYIFHGHHTDDAH
jgi:GDP-D-mannose dehydratase